MKTENRKLTELKENIANPRLIKDKNFKNLVKSLLANPKMMELRPIVLDTDMTILGGNMRKKALDSIAEMKPIKLRAMLRRIKCEDTFNYWVRWQDCPTAPSIIASELTDEQKQQFIIKDNLGYGEWDWDMLANQWDAQELEDWGMDLPTDWGKVEASEVEEDDFDEENEVIVCRCKKGEIWQLGNHRLMCGDSTSEEDVDKLMGRGKADMVLTDPPFGNNLGYGRGQLGARKIANDEDTVILNKFFTPLDTSLKNNTHCLVWIQWRTFSELKKSFEKYNLRTVVIWDKMQAGLSGGGFAEQYEMLCVFIKGKATQNHYSGNVWQVPRIHENRENMPHPHQKPIDVLAKAIDMCSNQGNIILDLFGGSGSTLIAAEQLNRICYMMELDEHYCDVIIARWEKLTGKTATKIE